MVVLGEVGGGAGLRSHQRQRLCRDVDVNGAILSSLFSAVTEGGRYNDQPSNGGRGHRGREGQRRRPLGGRMLRADPDERIFRRSFVVYVHY